MSLRAHHALSEEERKYCHYIASQDPEKLNLSEAWRKFFKDEYQKLVHEPKKTPLAMRVARKAKETFENHRIQAYLSELKKIGPDAARDVMLESAVLKDDSRAAEKVLDSLDKLNFRDAVDQFWEITAQHGGMYERVASCPHCDGKIVLEIETRDMVYGPEDSEAIN